MIKYYYYLFRKFQKSLLLTCILLLLTLFTANAQTREIEGRVVSRNSQESIPGVSVVIKGTSIGTITDMEGNYKITVSTGDVLSFSFLGMLSREVIVENQTVIDVQLAADLVNLSEVIVIGYGTQRKEDLTGAITIVEGYKLTESGFTSVDQALVGKAAGVLIESSDNSDGAASTIRIRGANSISGSSEPLFVIDGIPIMNDVSQRTGEPATLSPLAGLSPSDIESINILKDASATAIYGAQGANGVIIITTKKGKKGVNKMSYNSFFGIQNASSSVYNMLDSYGFAKYRQSYAFPYPKYHLTDSIDLIGNRDAQWYDISNFKDTATYDWLEDYILRRGFSQDHHFSLTGASEDVSYNIGLGYVDNIGIVENTNSDRISLNIGLNTHSDKKLQFGLNTMGSMYNNHGMVTSNGPNQGVGDNTAGILLQALRYRPMTPLYDENGEMIVVDDEGGGNLNNPYVTVTEVDMNTKGLFLNGNTFAQFNFTDHLNFRASAGGNINNHRFLQWVPSITAWGRRDNAYSFTRYTNNRKFVSDMLLNYTNTFKDIHKIELMGGYSISDFDSYSTTARINDYDVQLLGINQIGLGSVVTTPTSYSSGWALQSYLARGFYSFNNKYSATASFRADGSSRVSPDKKWGYFPSAAFAWRIDHEDFMESINWISQLKMRISYGVTGNQNIPAYQFYSTYAAQMAAVNNTSEPSASVQQLQNSDLKWETTDQYNIGLDYAFFGNRVYGSIEAYKKITNDLLLRTIVPEHTGLSAMFRNMGSMENKGLEFSVSSVNVDNGKLKFTSNFIIALNKNEITSLGGSDTVFVDGSGGNNVLIVGQPIGLWWGLETNGIWQQDEFTYSFKHDDGPVDADGDPLPLGWNLNPNPDGTYPASYAGDEPGSRKFVDQNGDSTINDKDQVIIGTSQPLFTGSFSNVIMYKGFDLNVMFDFSYGKDVFHASKWWLMEPNTSFQNKLDADYFELAQYEIIFDEDGDPVELGTTLLDDEDGNPLAGNPSNENIRHGRGNAYQNYNDAYIEDGSYLRIRTLSFGYTFNKSLTKKYGISRLRLYITATNLYTFTKYTGYDPAVNTSTLNGQRLGYDYSAHPLPKTVIFGVNLEF